MNTDDDFMPFGKGCAVALASDILRMADRLAYLEMENAQLRQVEREHVQFLVDTIGHNESMMFNTLALGLKLCETGYFDNKRA